MTVDPTDWNVVTVGTVYCPVDCMPWQIIILTCVLSQCVLFTVMLIVRCDSWL